MKASQQASFAILIIGVLIVGIAQLPMLRVSRANNLSRQSLQYNHQGKPTLARSYADAALQLDGTNVSALVELGTANFLDSNSGQNRLEDAKKTFQLVLAIEPQNSHALGYLATISAIQGDRVWASEYAEKFDKAYPKGATTPPETQVDIYRAYIDPILNHDWAVFERSKLRFR